MLVCFEGTTVHVDGMGYGEIVSIYEQEDGSPKYEIIFADGHRGYTDNSKISKVSLKIKGLSNARGYFDYDVLKNHIGFVSPSTEIDPDIYEMWKEEGKTPRYKRTIERHHHIGYTPQYPFSGHRAAYYIPASSLAPYSSLPKPKHMLLNGDYTTVVWQDGTHTIVKRHPLDEDDLGKAIMFCILKKMCGSKANLDRYLDKFTDNMVVKSLGGLNQDKDENAIKEFLETCDAIDAAGGLNQEYNPDEDEEDEEDDDDTE